ncbi:hypothetical protein NDU88_002674 [Pleurodeles waltl]|uniref:Uncharacterized protein n=1 Tax=Pleurodeles waltl TaxID=8319 RepID=A0AAV7WT16_PLEWA|nr:hypothetical protein NDU88_002674 [Pleurodeles waltl]
MARPALTAKEESGYRNNDTNNQDTSGRRAGSNPEGGQYVFDHANTTPIRHQCHRFGFAGELVQFPLIASNARPGARSTLSRRPMTKHMSCDLPELINLTK